MKNIQDLGKPCFNFTDDVSEFDSDSTPMVSLSNTYLCFLFIWQLFDTSE